LGVLFLMTKQEEIDKRLHARLKKRPKGWAIHLKNIKIEEFNLSCTKFSVEELFATPVIYFLEHNGNVVYVGQSESLMTRISQHFAENTKIFTTFSFIPFKGSYKQRLNAEKKYIKNLCPFYNKVHNN
jgi:hypothetical protein